MAKYKPIFVTAKMVRVRPEVRHTRAVMLPSGLLNGRRVAAKGDGTKFIQMTRNVDTNRNGRIDDGDLLNGQIVGRLPKGAKLPSRIRINRHYRKNRIVRGHSRKIR